MKKFIVTSALAVVLVSTTLFGGNLKAFGVNNTAVAAAATACKNGSNATVKVITGGTNCADINELIKNTNSTDINELVNNILKEQKSSTATPTKASTKAPSKTSAQTPAPTKTPSKTTTSDSSGNYDSSFASQVLKLVNAERAKGGLSALTMSQNLVAPANKRAQEIVQKFSHTRPNGTQWSTVLEEYNVSVTAAGENLAYGYNTPEAVVEGWMNSPGHRANIMNANFHKIGIGVYKDSKGTVYCTQLFSN